MSDCRGIVVGLFGFTVFELVEWFSGLGSSPGGRANHFHTRYLRFCAWLAGFLFFWPLLFWSVLVCFCGVCRGIVVEFSHQTAPTLGQ